MAQKIFATRGELGAHASGGDLVEIAVDQVVVVREHGRVRAAAAAMGLKKASPEVAVAYDGRCVGVSEPSRSAVEDLLPYGVLLGRAGAGFPAAVHIERFASPARLCVTDEPRLAGVGGIGMLSLTVPAGSLAGALVRGTVSVRPPVSIQVQLSGKLRPFVCAIDAALELVRRGIADVVQRVESARGAPVVLEFAGPSARTLSVAERSVLAGIAPLVGAAGSLFLSDERTEVFLRDQRRSKAHRALAPDPGAPCEDVVSIDLGAVDPLLLDARGTVRAVRDFRGQAVSQVLLGGDRGVTLRDLFAAATLLKSKRVPPGLDFLLAVPSRQMLEVLSRAGALTDLIATGARLVEPDAGVLSGEMYAPARSGVALRSSDLEPFSPGSASSLVASAETLAYAVATGEVGDPRSFKRPVRVTVPRALPTDDVLLARKAGRPELARIAPAPAASADRAPWQAAETLALVAFDAATLAGGAPPGAAISGVTGLAVACNTLQELRWLCARADDLASGGAAHPVRAVVATSIPRLLVSLLSAAGIAALGVDAAEARSLTGVQRLVVPAPTQWADGRTTPVDAGSKSLALTWLAVGPERASVTGAVRGLQPTARRVVGSATTGPAIAPPPESSRPARAGGGLARAGVSDPRRPVAQR